MIREEKLTPMHELLEHLNDVEDVGYSQKLSPVASALIQSTIMAVKKVVIDEYIEKEKKVIEHAWDMGKDWGVHGDPQHMPNGGVYVYYKYKD